MTQLEFDRLVLVESERITMTFDSLQVLSVDSVEIVHITPKFRSVTPRLKSSGQTPAQSIWRLDDSVATPELLKTNFICKALNLTAVFLGKSVALSGPNGDLRL